MTGWAVNGHIGWLGPTAWAAELAATSWPYVVVDRGARAIDRGQRHQDVHRLERIDQRAGVAGRELVVDVLYRLGRRQVSALQQRGERRPQYPSGSGPRPGRAGRTAARRNAALPTPGAAAASASIPSPADEPQLVVAADGKPG